MACQICAVPSDLYSHRPLQPPATGICPLELNDELCLAVDTVRGCGLAIDAASDLLAPRKSDHRA